MFFRENNYNETALIKELSYKSQNKYYKLKLCFHLLEKLKTFLLAENLLNCQDNNVKGFKENVTNEQKDLRKLEVFMSLNNKSKKDMKNQVKC